MDYNPKRGFIFVDSSDRQSGNSGNFRVSFNPTIRNIQSLRLESATIPYSWYDVVENVSFLLVEESAGGGTFQVTVPTQHYSPSDLATALSTAMTTASLNGYVYNVSYNANSGKYLIASLTIGDNFRLLWTTSTVNDPLNYMPYFLGFNNVNTLSLPDPDSGFAGIFQSSGIGAMAQEYIWIRISPIFITSQLTTAANNVSFTVPINGNWLDKIQYNFHAGYEQHLYIATCGQHLKDIEIQLFTQDNQPLDTNGVQSSFVFSYTTTGI